MKEHCNEVFDYNADNNTEDVFKENQEKSSETNHNIDSTESSKAVDEQNIKNVQYSKDGKTTEMASMDPDAEWITTKHTEVRVCR
jgi:hypothetical protein